MFMVLLSSSMDREENGLGLSSGPDPQCTLTKSGSLIGLRRVCSWNGVYPVPLKRLAHTQNGLQVHRLSQALLTYVRPKPAHLLNQAGLGWTIYHYFGLFRTLFEGKFYYLHVLLIWGGLDQALSFLSLNPGKPIK